MEGARSARDRRASDQLKPSPSRRDALDLPSGGEAEVLAAGDRAEAGPAAEAEGRGPATEGPDPREVLPFPVLPARASRSACAPKDIRRPKGELGVALGGDPSASSATASSAVGGLDPHELDRLPRRKARLPKVEV